MMVRKVSNDGRGNGFLCGLILSVNCNWSGFLKILICSG